MKYLKTHEGYIEDLQKLDNEKIKIIIFILKDIEEIMKNFGEIRIFYKDEYPEEDDVFSEFEGNNFILSDYRIMIEDPEIIDNDDRWESLELIKLEEDEILAEACWSYGSGEIYLKYQNPYVLVDILNTIKTLTPELMEERKVRRESHKFNF